MSASKSPLFTAMNGNSQVGTLKDFKDTFGLSEGRTVGVGKAFVLSARLNGRSQVFLKDCKEKTLSTSVPLINSVKLALFLTASGMGRKGLHRYRGYDIAGMEFRNVKNVSGLYTTLNYGISLLGHKAVFLRMLRNTCVVGVLEKDGIYGYVYSKELVGGRDARRLILPYLQKGFSMRQLDPAEQKTISIWCDNRELVLRRMIKFVMLASCPVSPDYSNIQEDSVVSMMPTPLTPSLINNASLAMWNGKPCHNGMNFAQKLEGRVDNVEPFMVGGEEYSIVFAERGGQRYSFLVTECAPSGEEVFFGAMFTAKYKIYTSNFAEIVVGRKQYWLIPIARKKN
jgi:hypothetical protein